jgi:acetate CoA/acetoacetate CoA-transferase alpha subunit
MDMGKFITAGEAAGMIPENAVIMVGGFMGCGNPHKIVAELAKLGTGGITLICNDASMPGGPDGDEYYGVAKLIHNRQVKKLITSHVGLNPEVAAHMNAGLMEVELVPQGSLAEMVRAGGAGLGGVLTPTGLGTIVEKAGHVHSVIEIDGKSYLVERPLRADFALLSGYRIDRAGNIWYRGTTRNFNLPMATAAGVVIAEADHLVDIGAIEPENVMTSGVFVDYIVEGGRADG